MPAPSPAPLPFPSAVLPSIRQSLLVRMPSPVLARTTQCRTAQPNVARMPVPVEEVSEPAVLELSEATQSAATELELIEMPPEILELLVLARATQWLSVLSDPVLIPHAPLLALASEPITTAPFPVRIPVPMFE